MNARRERCAVAVIVVAMLATYARTLRGELLFDDYVTIVGNPAVQGPFSLRALLGRESFGASLSTGAYRPLTTLSFWIDEHVSGRAWFFHAVNLALYALVLVLGYRFWKRWAGDAMDARVRLVALACFAAMTIHVEVVASVTARSELLATAFSLIACDLVVAEMLAGWRAAVAVGALGCAILSRESALPLLVFAPILAARRHPKVGAWLPLSIACAVMLVAMLGWRLSHGGLRVVPVNNVLSTYAWPARIAGGLDVLERYFEHLLTGIDLCPDYAYASVVPDGRLSARAVGGGAAVAALGALILGAWRRAPRDPEAGLAFGATFIVSSNLLVPAGGIMSDRFFFFPSFWLCALGALGATRLYRARARSAFALAAIGVAYPLAQLSLTLVTVGQWADRARFYGENVASCPTNHRLHIGEAGVLARAGAPREAAWELLIASAIVRRFPAPIAPSVFPLAWNELPLDARVDALRARLGSDDELEAVRRLAIVVGNGYGLKGAAAELLRWPTPVAVPPWDARWTAPSTRALESQ